MEGNIYSTYRDISDNFIYQTEAQLQKDEISNEARRDKGARTNP